jgi:hypothetical protein
MPLQVTRAGLTLPDADEFDGLRATFERCHCVLLPAFVEPHLVRWLFRRAMDGEWQTIVHDDLEPPAVDLLLRDDVAWGAIATLLNDPALFEAVRRITGCEPIARHSSRVYRMDPGGAHRDTWHGDNDGRRILTLSMNLGHMPFEGGELEIRDKGSTRLLHRVANTGEGDAILFRIAPDLQHRVREVTGTVSKFAVAGWFERAVC